MSIIGDDFLENYKPDPSLIDPVLREMLDQNDRGAAITGASFLTDRLASAIAEQWPPMSQSKRLRIFEGNGPLNSFSSRIDLAGAMGVLHDDARADFHKVRALRNRAAHLGTPFSFEGENEAKLIEVLLGVRRIAMDDEAGASVARNKFTGTVKILSMYLLFQREFKKKFGHHVVMPHFNRSSADG